MTPEQLTKLKDGDIIRNLSSGDAYNVLRNTGSTVIAARTLEVTNAPEWEHVYTTPSPTVFEMIDALESCGWTYDASRFHGWIAPDGFAETSLHRAYELRDEHPRLAPGVRTRHKSSPWVSLVEKGPRPYPGPVMGPKELEDAGWTLVSPNAWKSPSGSLHGPNVAWRIMDNAKIAACTAAGARPKIEPYPSYVPSFIPIYHVRKTELENAGWKNPYRCYPKLSAKLQDAWLSPEGVCYGESTAAWTEMTRQRIEKLVGNPS